jgi:Protein of unknown function (DUF3568)
LLGIALAASGCASLLVTALGVGISAGVSSTVAGYTSKTFTAPIPQVRSATVTALNRMGMKIESSGKVVGGITIRAKGGDREIEVWLETVTGKATRMRTIAKQGTLIYDSATSTEIILQTERVLSRG